MKISLRRRAKTKEPEQKFQYSVDSPGQHVLKDRRIIVKGWLVPKGSGNVKAMRVKNGKNTFAIPYGIERKDVAMAFPTEDPLKATRSGFELHMEFEDGPLEIEVNLGKGFEPVCTLNMLYVGGDPTTKAYNPHLSSNWLDHADVLESRSRYFFEDDKKKKYNLAKSDAKLIAFYLPQFHPIPENNKAWGEGFTEWTNVTTAQPRFIGHQQPFLPKDLGYYDLRLEHTIERQIELAKKHGLYGFCFYYYWFSGKEVLEKPLNTFLKHKEWDFNFMICWANENWTKRWDGEDKEIIIAQKYLPGDPLKFIKKVEHILLDPRYIRIDGKPALAVYRAPDLKEPARYAKVWRNYFRKTHGLELHLISMISFDATDPKEYGFDAGIEFMPQGVNHKIKAFRKNPPNIDVTRKLLDINFSEPVSDFRAIVQNDQFHEMDYPYECYKCVMPSWDNDARRKGKGSVYFYSSPDLYAKWLARTLERKPKDNIVFINAWNEWGEGTVLEPSMHYGHAILNRTSEVLARYGKSAANKRNFPLYGIDRKPSVDLAVIIHLFYTDQWKDIKRKLANISGTKWDLFVTLQQKDKAYARTIKKAFPDAYVFVAPNRGRDILPFVHLARRIKEAGYTSVLKLHTKRSLHRKDGNRWFDELLDRLLPSKEIVHEITQEIAKGGAIIGPKGHLVSLEEYVAENEGRLKELLTSIYGPEKAKAVLEHKADYGFVAGSMFWASMDVLRPLLDLHLMPEDFEIERGQRDGTTAHAIERLLGILPSVTGGHVYLSDGKGYKKANPSKSDRNYKYTR